MAQSMCTAKPAKKSSFLSQIKQTLPWVLAAQNHQANLIKCDSIGLISVLICDPGQSESELELQKFKTENSNLFKTESAGLYRSLNAAMNVSKVA